MVEHAIDNNSQFTDLLKLVGSRKKASLPLYTQRIASIFLRSKINADGYKSTSGNEARDSSDRTGIAKLMRGMINS